MKVKIIGSKIILQKGKQKITLTKDEFSELETVINKELYYRGDIEKYFEDNSDLYDAKAILADEALMSKMLDGYAILREKSCNGEAEIVMSWNECLAEILYYYDAELKQYEIAEKETKKGAQKALT